MAKLVTTKQRAVLEFIVDFKAEHHQPPSHAEIQSHFRWRSRNTVQRYLDALEAKGKIRRSPGRHRSIALAS